MSSKVVSWPSPGGAVALGLPRWKTAVYVSPTRDTFTLPDRARVAPPALTETASSAVWTLAAVAGNVISAVVTRSLASMRPLLSTSSANVSLNFPSVALSTWIVCTSSCATRLLPSTVSAGTSSPASGPMNATRYPLLTGSTATLWTVPVLPMLASDAILASSSVAPRVTSIGSVTKFSVSSTVPSPFASYAKRRR